MTEDAIENRAKSLNNDDTEEQIPVSKNITKGVLSFVSWENAKERHRRHSHCHQMASMRVGRVEP